MCRWFAYISSSEDCLLEDVLVVPAHSLCKQVDEHYLPYLLSYDPDEATTEAEIVARNYNLNDDGFGMAWYTPAHSLFSDSHALGKGQPHFQPILHAALYKTIQPPIHDANFRSMSGATSTTCVLAHIRASSGSPVVSVNNHPFTFGRHAIMHNGTISSFHAIARQMENLMSDEAFAHIGGSTDTEHLAALYMTYLTSSISPGPNTLPRAFGGSWERQYTTLEMLTALRRAVNTIIDLQNALGDKVEPNDLNVCVTDGQQLVAIRFRNHPTEQPPSLYYSTTAGATFNRKYPDHPDGANSPFGPAGGNAKVAVGQGRGHDAHGHDLPACEDGEEHEFMKVGPGWGGEGPGHNPYAYKRPEEHGGHVIVASEPMTYNEREWTLIKKNHVVMVSRDDKVVVQKF